jgi:hypothetical protein
VEYDFPLIWWSPQYFFGHMVKFCLHDLQAD